MVNQLSSCIEIFPRSTGLFFKDCTSLRQLFKSIGNLGNIESLCLEGCRLLDPHLPDTIGNCRKLIFVYFWGCQSLVILPNSISCWSALGTLVQVLDINNCHALTRLPGAAYMRKMVALKDIFARDCTNLVLHLPPGAVTVYLCLTYFSSGNGKYSFNFRISKLCRQLTWFVSVRHEMYVIYSPL
jgi:hypothetical protein